MPVPDDIDDALLGLGRQAGLSSVLRSLEAALDRAVSSAFQRSPPYSTDVTKTLDLLRACLTFTGSRSASSGDKLELPRLQRLAAMLQERLAPPSPQPPPAVWIAHEATSRKMEPRAPTAARPIRVRPPAPPARVDPERVDLDPREKFDDAGLAFLRSPPFAHLSIQVGRFLRVIMGVRDCLFGGFQHVIESRGVETTSHDCVSTRTQVLQKRGGTSGKGCHPS